MIHDIKKVYDFFTDTKGVEETRQKQLQIALAAKQTEKGNQAAEEPQDTDVIVNTQESSGEESSAENQ